MQKQINYSEIVELGFIEEPSHDPVYERMYGFPYVIIYKHLTKKIYIDWAKETRLCEMVRTDKNSNVKKRMPVKDLAHLKELIDFYTN